MEEKKGGEGGESGEGGEGESRNFLLIGIF